MLHALRRQPDAGFAVHDTSSRIEQLLAERRELRALLQHRPADPQPAFRQAERALASAKNQLNGARYRLDLAQKHLDEIRPLTQLRRHGRKDKASTLDRIETFTNQVDKAEGNVARCEQALEDLRPELDRRRHWDQQHGWPADRLHALDAELAEFSSPTESLSRDACGIRRAHSEALSPWLDQVAEVVRPPLPGRDMGAGMDLGL